MKKIIPKTNKSAVKKTVEAVKTELPSKVASVKKINFVPVIGLIIVALAVYAYYRFGIVATVNGKPISRFAYYQSLEKQDKKATVTQLVNEAIVYQEAAKQKITIDQATIDSGVKKIEDQIKAQGQTLEAALTTEGMTKADLENEVRLQALVEKLAGPAPTASQTEIDKFLADNKSALPTGYTKQQLQDLAKEQVESESKNTAINTWFSNLKKAAQVIIR